MGSASFSNEIEAEPIFFFKISKNKSFAIPFAKVPKAVLKSPLIIFMMRTGVINMDMSTEGNSVHYVCKICGGVSDTPKNCETIGCAYNGKPLTECRCTDGNHGKSPNAEIAPEKK